MDQQYGNQDSAQDSALEQRARELLLESIGHTDARTRSRLNQSRQAALAVLDAPASWLPSWLTRPGLKWTLLPATGAAGAAALAVVFMLHTGTPAVSPLETANALDVIDLVTDDDALDLMEDGDDSFYEWAAEQDAPDGSTGAGSV